MAIISIVARVETNGRITVKIFGASPDIATVLHNTFPALELSLPKNLANEWVGKSQNTSMTLTGIIQPQTWQRHSDQNEFNDNLLEEVTSYLNFLTKYKFSVVSVTRDTPTKYNYGQPFYTWTLQQPLNQSTS